jgi:hypothetical protein
MLAICFILLYTKKAVTAPVAINRHLAWLDGAKCDEVGSYRAIGEFLLRIALSGRGRGGSLFAVFKTI